MRDDKASTFVITDYELNKKNVEFFDKKESDKDYRCHYEFLENNSHIVKNKIFGADICTYQEDDFNYEFDGSGYIYDLNYFKYPGTKKEKRIELD